MLKFYLSVSLDLLLFLSLTFLSHPKYYTWLGVDALGRGKWRTLTVTLSLARAVAER